MQQQPTTPTENVSDPEHARAVDWLRVYGVLIGSLFVLNVLPFLFLNLRHFSGVYPLSIVQMGFLCVLIAAFPVAARAWVRLYPVVVPPSTAGQA